MTDADDYMPTKWVAPDAGDVCDVALILAPDLDEDLFVELAASLAFFAFKWGRGDGLGNINDLDEVARARRAASTAAGWSPERAQVYCAVAVTRRWIQFWDQEQAREGELWDAWKSLEAVFCVVAHALGRFMEEDEERERAAGLGPLWSVRCDACGHQRGVHGGDRGDPIDHQDGRCAAPGCRCKKYVRRGDPR